jgi:hypothetical protein
LGDGSAGLAVGRVAGVLGGLGQQGVEVEGQGEDAAPYRVGGVGARLDGQVLVVEVDPDGSDLLGGSLSTGSTTALA